MSSPAALFQPETGFRIESPVVIGVPAERPLTAQPVSKFPIEETNERWYKKFFVDRPHALFVGKAQTLGSVVLALIREAHLTASGEKSGTKEHMHRAVVFSKKGRLLSLFPAALDKGSRQSNDVFLQIAESCGLSPREFTDILMLRSSAAAKLVPELESIERMETPERLIIGVVNGADTQTELDHMWGNRDASSSFDRFMAVLGAPVGLREVGDDELTRFAGFGGAAPDEPCIIYRTNHAGYDVLFHVSTLLPYSTTDNQQLARKRKIGNDIGVLVFTESSEPFHPTQSSSKVNHVLCVVRPEGIKGDVARYSVGCAVKDEVPTFGPVLRSAEFPDERSLRDLILSKIINGMRAAYNHAPGFKREDTMRALLDDVLTRYSGDAKWQSWVKTNKKKQRAVLMVRDPNAPDGSCSECKKPVANGTGVTAMGKVYHAEHFCCAHCAKPFGDEPYIVNHKEQKAYCEEDYMNLFCPRCAQCNEQVDVFVRAMGKAWHLAHFCCAECDQPIGEDVFFERDGKPYCQTDFNAKYGETCVHCSKSITSSYIEFMGVKYHPECHVCAACKKQLVGPSVLAMNRAYHPDCFTCEDCKAPLKGKIYTFDDVHLCELHFYTRNGGLCQHCRTPCISGSICEVDERQWHADHFFCTCGALISNGDPFALIQGRPTCAKCLKEGQK